MPHNLFAEISPCGSLVVFHSVPPSHLFLTIFHTFFKRVTTDNPTEGHFFIPFCRLRSAGQPRGRIPISRSFGTKRDSPPPLPSISSSAGDLWAWEEEEEEGYLSSVRCPSSLPPVDVFEQRPVPAPGYMGRHWTKGGRRSAHSFYPTNTEEEEGMRQKSSCLRRRFSSSVG